MTSPRRSIEERPSVVETRRRIGDMEAGTIIGKNHPQAIVSLVERKAGFTLIRTIERNCPSSRPGREWAALSLSKAGAYHHFGSASDELIAQDFTFGNVEASPLRGTFCGNQRPHLRAELRK